MIPTEDTVSLTMIRERNVPLSKTHTDQTPTNSTLTGELGVDPYEIGAG